MSRRADNAGGHSNSLGGPRRGPQFPSPFQGFRGGNRHVSAFGKWGHFPAAGQIPKRYRLGFPWRGGRSDETMTSTHAWLESLTQRGIRPYLRNGRLAYDPPNGYGQLTDAEFIFARHNRAAIREALSAREDMTHHATTAPEPATASAAAVAKPEPACPCCYRAPCIGLAHPAFEALHPDDPTLATRRRQEALAEMMERLFQPSRWDV